jgi:UDP-N-acetylglucosamine 2-epimerase (hydrolysing)
MRINTVDADIINVDYDEKNISEALNGIDSHQVVQSHVDFGEGNSAELFFKCLLNKEFWKINHQKQFRDI